MKMKTREKEWSSISSIIHEYVNQLYFLRGFSPEVKNDYRIKCEAYVKTHIIDNKNGFIDFENEDFLFSNPFFREMENFKLNSFFLNMMLCTCTWTTDKNTEAIIQGLLNNLYYPFETVTHLSDIVKEFDYMDILDTLTFHSVKDLDFDFDLF